MCTFKKKKYCYTRKGCKDNTAASSIRNVFVVINSISFVNSHGPAVLDKPGLLVELCRISRNDMTPEQ